MPQNLKQTLIAHKITLGFILALIILSFLGFSIFNKFTERNQNKVVEEIDLAFDAEGPYALLYPRRDGNALVLNLKRTASYDSITYELAYTSITEENTVGETKKKALPITDEGDIVGGSIDRGVQGTIDTKEKKGEYEQEILFGTCSKNVCKYDKGVENGTLTLHIRKGDKAYKMITQWHLQSPDVALGLLASGDTHFTYKIDGTREELALIGYTIINDLSGAPKLPEGKQVLGKVYGLNVPIAKSLTGGDVTIELAENPEGEAIVARYDDGQNKWVEMETKNNNGKLSARADGAGVFAVLIPKK